MAENINIPKNKTLKWILVAIFSASLILNTYFCVNWFITRWQMAKIQSDLQLSQKNSKKIAFANLFIEKVLQSTGTVSFDDRLLLENSVRDINDKAIFTQWQKFTASSGGQSQQEASILLEMLLK